jgi:hypothetical protein
LSPEKRQVFGQTGFGYAEEASYVRENCDEMDLY